MKWWVVGGRSREQTQRWREVTSLTFVVGVVVQRPGSSPDARGGVGGGASERYQWDVTTVGEFVQTQITVAL